MTAASVQAILGDRKTQTRRTRGLEKIMRTLISGESAYILMRLVCGHGSPPPHYLMKTTSSSAPMVK